MTEAMDMATVTELLTPWLRYATLGVCVVLTVGAYHLMGRRFHERPHLVLLLGLVFMLVAVWFYTVMPQAAHSPVDVSIAALGGNLVASALVMRAAREHRRHRHTLQREIDGSEHLLAMLNTRRAETTRDNPLAQELDFWAANIEVELEEKKRDLHQAEREA